MIKTNYFFSTDTIIFIDVYNPKESKETFHIFFSKNHTLFNIENQKASDYTSFETAYKIDVEALETISLEISPRCSTQYTSGFAYCNIISSDKKETKSYKLIYSAQKPKFRKTVQDFINLPKADAQKEETSTFSLLSTNPRLTGNIKIQVDSNNSLYLSLMDIVGKTDKNTRFPIARNSDYPRELSKFMKNVPILDNVFYNPNVQELSIETKLPYSDSYTSTYNSGCSFVSDSFFSEKYSIFAPIYITDRVPKKFIIFRKQNFQNINSSELLKDLEIVKTFDIENTELGIFLNNTKNLKDFNKEHISTVINIDMVYAEVCGISFENSCITTKYDNLNEFIDKEQTQTSLEDFITSSYSRNNIVSHKIFNLEFLFDVDTKEFEFWSYFGMYVDDIEISKLSLETLDFSKSKISKLTFKNPRFPNSQYVNDGSRLFYVSDYSKNLYNILDFQENSIILDKETEASNFILKDSTTIINSDIIESTYPFAQFEFLENFQEDDTIEIRDSKNVYKYSFVSKYGYDFVNYEEQSTFPEKQHTLYVTQENSKFVYDGEYFIDDMDTVILYDSDDNQTSGNIIKSEISEGRTYYTIDSEDVVYIKHISSKFVNKNVPLGNNINDSLSALMNSINTTKSNFFAVFRNGILNIVSKDNKPNQKVILNYSRTTSRIENVLYFNKQATFDFYDLNGTDYPINVKSFAIVGETSTNECLIPIGKNEIYKIQDNTYITTSEGNKKLLEFSDGLWYIPNPQKLSDGIQEEYLIKTNRVPKQLEKFQTFNISEISYGILSFYDVVEFDYDRVSSELSAIQQESNHIFKSWSEGELIYPNSFYEVRNNGVTDINLDIQYSKKGLYDFKTFMSVYVSSGEKQNFSTVLMDYDIDLDSTEYDFVYSVQGGSCTVTSYLLDNLGYAYASDGLERYNNNTLNYETVYSNLKDEQNPSYINYPYTNSEYSRFQENSILGKGLDIYNNFTNKWSSPTFKDVHSDNLRLNLNNVFGLTGFCTIPTNFQANEKLHSHEWFILEEYPDDLEVSNKSFEIYGFSRISKSKFLSSSYDYFTEYFESGYPCILENDIPFKAPRKTLYSNISKITDNLYETNFKGVKYKFESVNDLKDYKFSILLQTRQNEDDDNSLNISDSHCNCCDDIPNNCSPIGFLPILKNELKYPNGTEKEINVKVSLVLPDSPVTLTNIENTTSEFTFTNITRVQFINELQESLNYWKALFEQIYIGLTLNFNIVDETIEYPVSTDPIAPYTKDLYNIGDIRIALTGFAGGSAKSYIVTNETEFPTPLILINKNKSFRLDSSNITQAFSMAYTLTHELSHIFGLGHTKNQESITYPSYRNTWNISEKFPNGLEYVDMYCIQKIYGSLVEVQNQPEYSEVCEKSASRKKDTIEFLVNEKFKTITLRLSMNLENLITRNSRKSYLDLYMSKTLQRYTRENNVLDIEGSDVLVPNIYLNQKNVEMFNDSLLAQSKYFLPNLSENSGSEMYKSIFRLRHLEKSENYQIFRNRLDTFSDAYRLSYFFDDGVKSTNSITKIKDGADTTVETKLPMLYETLFDETYFYRVGGGSLIENINKKLTLDTLIQELEEIPFSVRTSDGNLESSKFFSMFVINPKPVQLNQSLVVAESTKNKNTQYEEILTSYKSNLLRYESSYMPKVQKVLSFGIREPKELSEFLNLDFFKCNTNVLYDSKDFGLIKNKMFRKISEENILFPLVTDESQLSFVDGITPIYVKNKKVFDSVLDKDFFDKFKNVKDSEKVSGFEDLLLSKNFLNSVIMNVPNNVYYNVDIQDVVLDYKERLEISVDLKKSLTRYLKSEISEEYRKYIDIEDFENSLTNFIEKNLLKLYSIEKVELYKKQTKKSEISYVVYNSSMIQDSLTTSIDLDILKGYKNIEKNFEVSVFLKFKYI